MSEFKGTPGPWRARHSSVLYGDNSVLLVCVDGSVLHDDEQIDFADARLIAAAPDLLEVLQEAQEFIETLSQYEMPIGLDDRINAAIAKALNTDTTERWSVVLRGPPRLLFWSES